VEKFSDRYFELNKIMVIHINSQSILFTETLIYQSFPGLPTMVHNSTPE